jgi:hypothetical protein
MGYDLDSLMEELNSIPEIRQACFGCGERVLASFIARWNRGLLHTRQSSSQAGIVCMRICEIILLGAKRDSPHRLSLFEATTNDR